MQPGQRAHPASRFGTPSRFITYSLLLLTRPLAVGLNHGDDLPLVLGWRGDGAQVPAFGRGGQDQAQVGGELQQRVPLHTLDRRDRDAVGL